MSELHFVALSAPRFGAPASVLTGPRRALAPLADALRDALLPLSGDVPPTLVLLGDVIDSGAGMPSAVAALDAFSAACFAPDARPLFDDRVIYLPGVHDRELRERARERAFIDRVQRTPPGKAVAEPARVTRMFRPRSVPCDLLTAVMRRYPHLRDALVSTVYPDFGLVTADGKRAVLFHAGHRLISEGREHVVRYIAGPLRERMNAELDAVPSDIVLTVGGTIASRPTSLDVDGFPTPVHVMTSGSWSGGLNDAAQAATLTLVDDNLDVVYISVPIRPVAADQAGLRILAVPRSVGSPLHREIEERVSPAAPVWSTLCNATRS